jgi:hypothetical protein
MMKKITRHQLISAPLLAAILVITAPAIGSTVQNILHPSAAKAATTIVPAGGTLQVYIGEGQIGDNLPYATSGLKYSDGRVAKFAPVKVTVTGDLADVTFYQYTDTDGRLRGQLFGDTLKKVGGHTVTFNVGSVSKGQPFWVVNENSVSLNVTQGASSIQRVAPVSSTTGTVCTTNWQAYCWITRNGQAEVYNFSAPAPSGAAVFTRSIDDGLGPV